MIFLGTQDKPRSAFCLYPLLVQVSRESRLQCPHRPAPWNFRQSYSITNTRLISCRILHFMHSKTNDPQLLRIAVCKNGMTKNGVHYWALGHPFFGENQIVFPVHVSNQPTWIRPKQMAWKATKATFIMVALARECSAGETSRVLMPHICLLWSNKDGVHTVLLAWLVWRSCPLPLSSLVGDIGVLECMIETGHSIAGLTFACGV